MVENQALLDKEKLWAFIPLAAKEQAFRAWAKNTGYTATIGTVASAAAGRSRS